MVISLSVIVLGVMLFYAGTMRPLCSCSAERRLASAAVGTVRALSGLAAVVIGLTSPAFASNDDDLESPKAESPLEAESSAETTIEEHAVAALTNAPSTASLRPDWLDMAPVRDGDRPSLVVSSGPFVTRAESRRALEDKLKEATNAYIGEYLGNSYAPHLLRYDLKYIREKLVRNDHQFEETRVFQVGEMKQSYAMLEFNNEFRQELDNRWHQVTAMSRLSQFGLIGGCVLAFLGTLLSYFKADTATRGYYTGRLKFATATAILAIVVASAVLARWIPWL